MYRRFAIVRDWEDTVSAEEEVIKRIFLAAQNLGILCDIVDTSYRILPERKVKVSSATHDFVLHIHYCSGKAENVFTFATLWNPLSFFHMWGYRESTSTLLTNDDFLTSGSKTAFNHIQRNISSGTYHLSPSLVFFPSPPKVAFRLLPVGDVRLLYCGINWERLNAKKGRLEGILKRLEKDNLINIYGPRIFHGTEPWKGFSSYRGEIPFDGVSMIKTIHDAGAALVFSSEDHIRDEIITNRLFETLSAGAVVIADENPAIPKLIGDNYLIVKGNEEQRVYEQIRSHIQWIRDNKEEAQELVSRAQEIFSQRLSAECCLSDLYANLQRRKEEIHQHRLPAGQFKVACLYFIDPTKDIEAQETIIQASIKANLHESIFSYVFTEKNVSGELGSVSTVIRCHLTFKGKFDFGREVNKFLNGLPGDYFCIVLPGEELFDDHIISLVKSLEVSQNTGACSHLIVEMERPEGVRFWGQRWNELLKVNFLSGSFLFHKSVLSKEDDQVVPYINYAIALYYALKAGRIASSKGYSCKLHWPVPKDINELNVIADISPLDSPLAIYLTPIVDARRHKTNFLRSYYDKHRTDINRLKKYPFLWTKLKYVFKKLT